eukprot:TRINITY_DN3862_c0_g2_i1.p1 TRINITY_DN3862_c0_g2~~TRINITY_DN3862_c0_g2_i1.p1  ORF type:complete len:160 (-),score=26.10 TRINITY_DN3862_c0_g2_i1:1317-1796(-)
MGRKVCLAVDDSTLSSDAVQWAAKNILSPQDEVHLLTIVKPVPLVSDDMEQPSVPWLRPPKEDYQAANSVLERLNSMLNMSGIQNVQKDRLVSMIGCNEGVGQAIEEYANKNNVEHVILGSRGLSSLSSGLLDAAGMGSVSDYCMKHLHCPVSVYHPQN